MNYVKNMIYRLPSIRAILNENKQLKEENSFLKETIEEIVVQNYVKPSHVKTEVSASSGVKEKANRSIVKKANAKEEEAFTFSKSVCQPEDKVARLAEDIVKRNPFGMASADYNGEPVKYQAMTKEDLTRLLQFCYENTSTEVNLDLGKKQTAIIEGHRDNTLSVEVYEDGHHLKSMKTGKKVINDEVVENYSDQDILECLKSYGQRG